MTVRQTSYTLRQRARGLWHVARHGAAVTEVSVAGTMRLARGAVTVPRGPAAMLRVNALVIPDRVAVVDGARTWTYAELDARIETLAHLLRSRGVNRGDRVVVLLHNAAEFFVVQWGVIRAGATAALVGTRSTAKELAYILEHSKPAACLFDAELGDVVRAARDAAPGAVLLEIPGDIEGHEAPRGRARAFEAPGSVMVYTSGTTGKPKGATRRFDSNQHVSVLDFMRQVGVSGQDRHLVVAPLYHSAAPSVAALVHLMGGTVCVHRRFDAEETVRAICEDGITSLYLPPVMIGRIMRLPARLLDRARSSSLRWVVATSAPLPSTLAREFQEVFGPVLWNFYGATETGLVTLAGPGDHGSHPGTIGRALPGNEIRLLDEHGHEVLPGQVGELWVRNSMLVSGYFGDARATGEASRDGFFSVGDLARVDSDGYYSIADRKVDMVISGGVNLYPQEIENHLVTHPDIVECAVVGVPDPDWGEALRAFVVTAPGRTLSADQVKAHCREALSPQKCPKDVRFVGELPRTPTGKVMKRELRQRP